MIKYIEVVLGIGSNLGDRLNYLNLAILKLEEKILKDIVRSSICETKAVLKKNSPKEWDLDFLNMAIRGKTSLTPLELIKALKEIEKEIGRRHSKIWSPREIDIDILVYGDQVIKLDNLIIPHPELLNRPFCLKPLAEVYPGWTYPIQGEYYQLSALEISSLI